MFICKEDLLFYGYIFTKDRIKPNPEKILEIQSTPQPDNIKAWITFLDLMNYFKKVNNDYRAHSLTDLLRKDDDFLWSAECQKAFAPFKQSLCNETRMS